MDMRKNLAILAAFACMMTAAGCTQNTAENTETANSAAEDADRTASTTTGSADATPLASVDTDTLADAGDLLTKADQNTDWDDSAVTLVFDGDGVTPSSTDGITVSEGKITITKGGDYVLSGTLDDGRIVVDLEDDTEKVHIILNGVSLTSKTSSPLTILNADKVIITLADGTENTVTDASGYTELDEDSEDGTFPDAAIASKCDLTINGSGTLTVNANYNNGIHCKDDLKLVSGTVTVNAANHGIRGNDSVLLYAADVTITSGGDAVKSSTTDTDGKGYVLVSGGSLTVNSQQDGIDAATALTVNGGTLYITAGGGASNAAAKSGNDMTGGGFGNFGGFGGRGGRGNTDNNSGFGGFGGFGEFSDTTELQQTAFLTETAETTDTSSGDGSSTKGLKAGTTLTVTGGQITVDSADDALHAGGSVSVTGGSLTIASGDDGIHSDADVTIGTENAGTFDDVSIYISQACEGIEGVYIYQNSGTVYVVSTDDGYNAAGGEFPSGTQSGNGRMGGMMSTSYGELYLRGGAVSVNSANGDHDGMDSNGSVYMTGGYYVFNGQEPIDCGEGYSIEQTGGSYITVTAGNTDLSTLYSFTDADGNVIVSIYSGSGSAGQSTNDCTAYSGGTLSGGTVLIKDAVTVGGKLSGGTEITAEPAEGMMGGFGGGFGRGDSWGQSDDSDNSMNIPDHFDGVTPPDGIDGMTPPDGFDGMTPPDGFSGGHRGGGFRQNQQEQEQ